MSSKEAPTAALFTAGEAPPAAVPFLNHFGEVITSPGFPCFFARSAWENNELLFGLGDVSTDFSEAVALFDLCVEAINSNIEQTIVLWLNGLVHESLEQDRDFAHRLLSTLLEADDQPWPREAPVDPSSPCWDFWYRGVDFFINVSTPNHRHRRSRNLGDAYTLMVQSRRSFDLLGEGSVTARSKIRKRIQAYDNISVAPALGTHGEQPEIDQFFLGDTNSPQGSRLLDAQQVKAALQKRGL